MPSSSSGSGRKPVHVDWHGLKIKKWRWSDFRKFCGSADIFKGGWKAPSTKQVVLKHSFISLGCVTFKLCSSWLECNFSTYILLHSQYGERELPKRRLLLVKHLKQEWVFFLSGFQMKMFHVIIFELMCTVMSLILSLEIECTYSTCVMYH